MTPAPLRAILMLSTVVAFGGCGGGGDAAPESGMAAQARAFYQRSCVTCHGEDGKGDTLAAHSGGLSPRDYSSPSWQAQTSDERIRIAILKGGGAVGLSETMPPHPSLADKPELTAALVELVRSFGGK